MVVPLATGVSENDDYQRACGRRETPLQGTDSFGSLPFHLLQFGDIDQDPVPEDLTDGQPPGPGMQSHPVRFAIGSTNRQLDVKDRELTG